MWLILKQVEWLEASPEQDVRLAKVGRWQDGPEEAFGGSGLAGHTVALTVQPMGFARMPMYPDDRRFDRDRFAKQYSPLPNDKP